MWEQWDTIVFRKDSEHGVRDVGGPGIVSQFQTVTGLENIDPKNLELVVASCLGIYLHSCQINLQRCDIVSATFGISQMFCNVELIFNQLKCRLIGHESTAGDRIRYTNID